MTKEQVRQRIEEIGIIPAIRVSAPEEALFAAEAVCRHGIPIVEVTMTVPGAIEVISELASQNPDVIAGAGNDLISRSCRSSFVKTSASGATTARR